MRDKPKKFQGGIDKNGIRNLNDATTHGNEDPFLSLLMQEFGVEENADVITEDEPTESFEELLAKQTASDVSALLNEKKPLKPKTPSRSAIVKVLKHHHPIQSTCDLHDLGWEEAEKKIRQTVSDASSFGFKKILIITGKGKRSPNGKPVLLPKTAELLRMMKKANLILDFELDKKGESKGGGYIVYLK